MEVLGRVLNELNAEARRCATQSNGESLWEFHRLVDAKMQELNKLTDRSMLDNDALLVVDLLDRAEAAIHLIRKAYSE